MEQWSMLDNRLGREVRAGCLGLEYVCKCWEQQQPSAVPTFFLPDSNNLLCLRLDVPDAVGWDAASLPHDTAQKKRRETS